MKPTSPSRRRRWFLKVALKLEKVYDAFHRFLALVTGRLGKPMVAEIYYAIRHEKAVSVKGRILLARKWPHPDENDPALVNLFHMLRRWATPERPYSLVRLSAGGQPIEQRADREGYFEIEIPLEDAHTDQLLIELPECEVSDPAHWAIRRSGEKAAVLIVSDIDDTVLVSHAAQILRLIATTLFGNALTRQLFPGTSELYKALKEGPGQSADQRNPIAYVTSSPFNLHGLIDLIFKENDLPSGAFFMTGWGLDEDRWLTRSHRDHKLEAIDQLLSWFPGMPAILIGDSGQHDTAIYVEAALTHPGAVSLILIRNVSREDRIETLLEEAVKLQGSPTGFAFFKESDEAASVLADAGWISPDQFQKVHEAVHREPPSLIERVTQRHHEDHHEEDHS